MLEELCKRIQHCCTTLRRSRNKRNVGSSWLKSLTGFKLCATTSNNIQQHATADTTCKIGGWSTLGCVQTDSTCNMQQYWELLVNNVASVCTQPNTLNVLYFSLQLDRDLLALQSVLNGTDLVLQSAIDSLKLIVANVNETLQNKVCWDTDKVIIS